MSTKPESECVSDAKLYAEPDTITDSDAYAKPLSDSNANTYAHPKPCTAASDSVPLECWEQMPQSSDSK